jgi:hypothetical protein
MRVRSRVLGELAIEANDHHVVIKCGDWRAILAALHFNANRLVSMTELIGVRPPVARRGVQLTVRVAGHTPLRDVRLRQG